MFTSQRFIDDRTGAIVVQVPISDFGHFEEYAGPVEAGGFDLHAIEADEPAFQVGDRVRVSNGKPRPPERFNRKLADWKCRNYDGTVKAIEGAESYQPQGAIQITPDGRGWAGCIEFVNHVPLGLYQIEVIR